MFQFAPAGSGGRMASSALSAWPFPRHLTIALSASIAFHVLLLSLHFAPDLRAKVQKDQTLEVVLVNARHKARPKDAQALAQANLDGGGNTEENRRAMTPLPPTEVDKKGTDLLDARRRVQQLEIRQKELLAQARSAKSVPRERKSADDTKPQPKENPGIDLNSSALVMARMEAEINKRIEEYNKRPRKYHYSPRTAEYAFAQYVEDWRQKIERVGNLNYPEEAKGRVYGSLLVTVTLKPNGEVDAIEVTRPSGQRVLDDAAKRIVRLAAPFPPFPAEMRRQMDLFVIPRVWVFTKSDQLVSEQVGEPTR